MNKRLLILVAFLFLALQACKNAEESNNIELLSPAEMQESVETNHNAQLVDVRTKEEFGVSHLKNAQNICVTSDDFSEKVKTLDKDKPVYVYCKKGGRSARAAQILKEMGFKKVYDLEGGLTNWEDEGLKTEN